MQNRGVCLVGEKKNNEINILITEKNNRGHLFSPPLDMSLRAPLLHFLASPVLLEQIAAVHNCLKRKPHKAYSGRISTARAL